MLIKSLDHLRNQGKEWKGVHVFGQEVNGLTSAIARMNLYLNGVEDFSIVCGDTLRNPAFLDGSHLRTFDIVLANPPYSIKEWDRAAFENDKWGRNFLGTPPQRFADYAFIQHILASMDEKNGRCAILLPHGVLNRMGEESKLRQKLIELDIIDCVISIGKNLFYNSAMEACILLCRSKKNNAQKGNILFIRATDLVERKNNVSYLTEDHIQQIVDLYIRRDIVEGLSAVINKNVVIENGGSLSTKLYVRNRDDNDICNLQDGYNLWLKSSQTVSNKIVSLLNLF
jgi:type I restriction enzyme M protein